VAGSTDRRNTLIFNEKRWSVQNEAMNSNILFACTENSDADRWQQLIIQVPAGQINWDGLFWLLFMAADKE
jgi:hypothetical protein